jgi:hypothetical protein
MKKQIYKIFWEKKTEVARQQHRARAETRALQYSNSGGLLAAGGR